MMLLDAYFLLQKKIYDYFGYREDWKTIPIDSQIGMFWILEDNGINGGYVRFSETDDDQGLYSDGNYYQNSIYIQRFLPRWVYPGEEYTMICVDTHTDGNKFLQIFDNNKRRYHIEIYIMSNM